VLTLLPKARWDERAATHLLNRAAFGGTPEEIAAITAKGLEDAVRDLIEVGATACDVSAPEWARPRDLRAIRMEARSAKQSGDVAKMRQARKMEGDELLDLRRWWLERIAITPAPLLEKMTLFCTAILPPAWRRSRTATGCGCKTIRFAAMLSAIL
jgi:uncharacterized protein (DUF1800 family)